MFYLVSYDITDDRRRTKLSKKLKDFGTRVQYSVFECILNATEFERMHQEMETIIDQEEDSIRIYQICAACEKIIAIIGKGCVTEDADIYVL